MTRSSLPEHHLARLTRLRRLSRLLDNAIALPGTDYRVGLDPLIGLLPGGGDLFTGLLSVYILLEAARFKVPAATLGRMGFNILLEVVTGTIPVVGDLFDVAWKANAQNVALLERHLQAPRPSTLADQIFAVAIIALLLFVIISIAGFSIWLVRQILQL
ncbi:MAG: DUF4112 domain-containing protein [Leptolyngbya sp. SIO4C1]|nr:DUF4112 domain-containing protein [Leptolyngbya sp. SIO4C1]